MSHAAGSGQIEPTTLRLCPSCDYDLRGIQSDRCPECGFLIENAPPLTIPWEHRRQMGRIRAFWRTAQLAMLHKRFAEAIAGPVDQSAAKRFRLIVSLIAAIPLAVTFVVVVWHAGIASIVSWPSGFTLVNTMSQQGTFGWEFLMTWGAGAALTPILPLGVIISVWLATSSARIWLMATQLAPERRKRAAAICEYACAPLVLQPIAALAAGALLAMELDRPFPGNRLYVLTSFVSLVIAVVVVFSVIGWWYGTLQLLARTTHCGWGRLICAAIGQPLAWAVCVMIGMGIWPCLAGLIWIAIDSCRR